MLIRLLFLSKLAVQACFFCRKAVLLHSKRKQSLECVGYPVVG